MDFLITEEQERFRQQVRSFLDKELPPDWEDYTGTAIDDTAAPREDGEQVFKDIAHKLGKKGWLSLFWPKEDGEQVFKDIAHKLGKKGWLSLFWPKEYGGGSWPLVDYLIFLEEMARRGSPGYNAVGVKMLAPTLFKYGTEE